MLLRLWRLIIIILWWWWWRHTFGFLALRSRKSFAVLMTRCHYNALCRVAFALSKRILDIPMMLIVIRILFLSTLYYIITICIFIIIIIGSNSSSNIVDIFIHLILLLITLTSTSTSCYKKVTSLVREFKREGITVIGSFSSHLSGKCQEMVGFWNNMKALLLHWIQWPLPYDLPQNPDLLHFCCFCKVLKILVSFYLGLLPFLTINESFFEIMMPSVGFE